jgi:uncharacterized protein
MPGNENALHCVLKVSSRCNLNCTYCYVYNKADQSWRSRPPLMPEEVFRAAISRIRRYCEYSRQPSISLTFHGGEPCLIGARRFDEWCSHASAALKGLLRVKLCLQTNGTLLSDAWIDVLARHEVNVGVSIDGTKPMHDQFRIDHHGRGSYDAVVRGLSLLTAACIPVQLLSVIQPGADPVAVHRHLTSLGVSTIHYLLPDFNHDTIQPVRKAFGPTPCADFLIPAFDEWFAGPAKIRVSMFWTIARLLAGGDSDQDTLGNPALRFAFIEAGGEIECLDVLRGSKPDCPSTGLNVLTSDLMELRHIGEFFSDIMFKGVPVPTGCRDCVEVDTCRGGYLPHRYSRNRELDNPSVWCADLIKLFAHIRTRLNLGFSDTAARRRHFAELATQVEASARVPALAVEAGDVGAEAAEC